MQRDEGNLLAGLGCDLLGLLGLPEEELRMFLDLRDGILHPEKVDPDARADAGDAAGLAGVPPPGPAAPGVAELPRDNAPGDAAGSRAERALGPDDAAG